MKSISAQLQTDSVQISQCKNLPVKMAIAQYLFATDNLPVMLSVLVVVLGFVYLEIRRTRKKSIRSEMRTILNDDGDDTADMENCSGDDDLTPSLEVSEQIVYNGATITLPGGARQFYELVNNRRTVRNFSAKPVPHEIIKDCIRAAGTAPSGAHTEPWTFCVIRDDALKQQIREIIENEEYINYSQRMAKQWVSDLKPFKTNHIKENLTDAPYIVLVFKQVYGMRSDGQRKQHYYNEISTSISVGILLCALQAAGLNSLVSTPLNCGPALKALLNRPANEKLLVLLTIGYAAEDCTVPDLKRKDLSEILVEY